MARNTFEAWIPEENDSAVLARVAAVSAVESLASHTPMTTDTKSTPRSAGLAVGYITKGSAYGEDSSVNDDVVLTARKFGEAIRVAEEDINDSLADILSAKGVDWATSYGKVFDNATLAVTAAVGTGVPFTSVYKTLLTTDADLDYTASDNISVATSAGITYDWLSGLLGLVETSDYFDDARMVVIAHPSFRASLRGVKDLNGMPVFIQGIAGTPDTLFGAPINWSTGAKANATASASPTGKAVMVYCNQDFLLVGDRSGPESMFVDGNTGLGALTDEAILKFRARKGFAVGHPKAFAIGVMN